MASPETEDDVSGAENAEPSSSPEVEESNRQDATDSSSRDGEGEQANSQDELQERTDGGGEASTSEGEGSKDTYEDQKEEGNPDPDSGAHTDFKALLQKERAQYDENLKREVKAREELEDMLLQMEKHFKSEQKARQTVEVHLEQTVLAEHNVKKDLENTIQKHSEEAQELENERDSTRMERQALESMRQEFENELQAARTEVAKAQDALKTAEDRVRCSERIERAKMEAEYQMRLTSLGNELERVREELIIRTQTLGEEMERWRLQAEYTAGAMIEAKGEVMERKRDLDVTRERMDRLVEKLFMGREQGIVLHGAISAAQMYNGQAQTRLLASMQNSYYNAVQASLPWGGEISQHGRIPALPPSESHMMQPEQAGNRFGHSSSTRKGAKSMGKGATQGETRTRKAGKSTGPGLPPLGQGSLYPGVPPAQGQKGGLWGQTAGVQAKGPSKNTKQRNKDRFAGPREASYGATGKRS